MRYPTLWACLILFFAPSYAYSAYVDLGTSLGSISSPAAFFGSTSDASSNTGFVGSLGAYFGLNSLSSFVRFQLGVQNKLSIASLENPSEQLASVTQHLGARIELGRFYAGAGYAPIVWKSENGQGFSSLTRAIGASAQLYEGGVIWNIVPEFQLCAHFGVETLSPPGAPSAIVTEYGLRLRFTINPKEVTKSRASSWDGFRYPFGIMRD
jgi:hypothetical protein